MKSLLTDLVYFILRKLYPFFISIEKEERKLVLERTLNRLKSCGNDVNFTYPYILSGECFIEIGNHFYSNANARIEAVSQYGNESFIPQIKIGNNVLFSRNCHIGAMNRIEIGDGTLLGSNVFITDHFHGHVCKDEISVRPIMRSLYSKGPVIIGKNVWIGENVCIMPNVTICNGVIIGANSVVTRSFGDNLVIAGNPAKVIKDLNI